MLHSGMPWQTAHKLLRTGMNMKRTFGVQPGLLMLCKLYNWLQHVNNIPGIPRPAMQNCSANNVRALARAIWHSLVPLKLQS